MEAPRQFNHTLLDVAVDREEPKGINHTPSSVPIEIEIVQDDRGGGGLRTLQLHSYIPQAGKGKRRIEKLTVGGKELTIDDLEGKTVEEIARTYLLACEETLNDRKEKADDDREVQDRESKPRGFTSWETMPTENKTQDDKKNASTKSIESNPKLYPEQIGKVRELDYKVKNVPATQEVLFGFKFGDYPIYGASVRIELTKKIELLSATIISPTNPGAFTMDRSSRPKDLKYILPIALEKAGYPPMPSSEIPNEWIKDDYPIKWYFDPNQEIWRLAYIIDNIPKKVEVKDRLTKGQEIKPSQRWGMFNINVSDYVVDAYNQQLIAEI